MRLITVEVGAIVGDEAFVADQLIEIIFNPPEFNVSVRIFRVMFHVITCCEVVTIPVRDIRVYLATEVDSRADNGLYHILNAPVTDAS